MRPINTESPPINWAPHKKTLHCPGFAIKSATGGSASRGFDYIVAAGALSFPPGDMPEEIEVEITDDSLQETDETVILTLSGATVEMSSRACDDS